MGGHLSSVCLVPCASLIDQPYFPRLICHTFPACLPLAAIHPASDEDAARLPSPCALCGMYAVQEVVGIFGSPAIMNDMAEVCT